MLQPGDRVEADLRGQVPPDLLPAGAWVDGVVAAVDVRRGLVTVTLAIPLGTWPTVVVASDRVKAVRTEEDDELEFLAMVRPTPRRAG